MEPHVLSDEQWLLPDGIEEILPGEAARLERLRRNVLDLFATWGYRLVVPPMVEFIESLLTGTGHDLDIQTFKLIDQVSGRLMGLRADMTPQVARIDARHAESDAPARLCYLGTVLHTVSDRLENSRCPMQVGAELYGHAGHASDLEIICLLWEMLAVAGLEGVHLDLGHVGIFRGLARQAALDGAAEGELFEILQRKAKPELWRLMEAARVPAESAQMFTALADLNGGAEILPAARQRLSGASPAVHTALAELGTMADALNRRFPGMPIHFDLAELRGYHYQTGIVFAAFVSGYGREIARGGRYDEIGRVFGRARPATGFSADLKVLLRFAARGGVEEEPPAIYAPACDDAELHEVVRALRAAGRCVIRELPGQSATPRDLGCREQLMHIGKDWQIRPVPAPVHDHQSYETI